jgi:hypothetical protein
MRDVGGARVRDGSPVLGRSPRRAATPLVGGCRHGNGSRRYTGTHTSAAERALNAGHERLPMRHGRRRGVPAMSISGGDSRPGDQALGWLARYPRGGIAARRRAGDVSQSSRTCAGSLGARGFGVDALALQLRATGARYATASSLPLRHGCAAHRGDRATVGLSGPDAATLWPGIHGGPGKIRHRAH